MAFRKFFIVTVLIFFAMAGGATRAQWRIVAPNLVPAQQNAHAMCFRDGILWIVANSLYKSLDTGLSWSVVSNPAGILLDVDFFDTTHGIIATTNNSYLTSDGGKSLKPLGHGANSACFGKDTLTLGIADVGNNVLAVTSDGGKTWMSNPTVEIPLCVRRSSVSSAMNGSSTMNGALLFFSGTKPQGYLTWTSDAGTTWNTGTAGIDWDSWSFAPDSCDPNRIYLSHEDAGAVSQRKNTDLFSKIILSTDLGNTWQVVVSNIEPFFCGSVAVGKEAIYCPTLTSGIFRSLDKGMTWSSINGPNNTYDSRLISAIDDNIIVAMDSLGNVWRTDNSGGDSVKQMPGLGTLTLSTHTLFISDTLSCGGFATEPIIMQHGGCLPLFVARATIVGADAPSYRIAFFGADSIAIAFEPQESGSYQSDLVLTLGDGTTDTVVLGGTSVGGNAPVDMATSDEKTDTIGGAVSVPIQFNGLQGAENIDVTMHYAGADLVYDSSVDPAGMKVDVIGDEWPGRSMLHFMNVQSGIIAGYARFTVFSDSTDKPVVTFDSVQIQAAGCKYQTPAPVSSTITPVQGCGVPIISELLTTGHVANLSIIPNPTMGDAFISSSSDLGNATIEIYDMLGALRSQTEMTLTANAPSQLTLPQADGMYTIRVRSAAGVFSGRVIVRR